MTYELPIEIPRSERPASIVNPDGPQEQLMRKIEKLKHGGLTSRQLDMAQDYEMSFIASFIKLSWTCMGLSKEDLKEYTEDELPYFGKLLTSKVRKRRRWFLLNPVTWFFFIGMRNANPQENNIMQSTLHYFLQLGRLKKYYSNDYFPSQAIYDYIRKKD